MPIGKSEYLIPTGQPDEKVLDQLKGWISDELGEYNVDSAPTADVVFALKAACDHIAFELDSQLKILVSDARTSANSMLRVPSNWEDGGEHDWLMVASNADDMKRDAAVGMLKEAKTEIKRMPSNIERLEAEMKRAKEKKEAVETVEEKLAAKK